MPSFWRLVDSYGTDPPPPGGAWPDGGDGVHDVLREEPPCHVGGRAENANDP